MKLISAEQMKSIVNKHIDKTGADTFTKHHIFEFLHCCDAVDAVPVVRCKDCQHYEPCEGGKDYCWWHDWAVVETDFCSCCERRSE